MAMPRFSLNRMARMLLASFAILLSHCYASVASTELTEELQYFRLKIEGRTVRLHGMTVKRSDSHDKLPIALITHGKAPNLASMLDLHPAQFVGVARDLARRGWLAVIVLRRGFGQSDGPIARSMTCATASFSDRFSADADDLQATLDLVGQRPDADETRAIAIGVSAGGPAVLALATHNPNNLLGVINISGGLRFETCSKEDALVTAFREFGARTRVPSLWLYAKNDTLFSASLVDKMHDAFLDGGGDVKLVMYDGVGTEGHQLFSRGRILWLMELDAFLRFRKLPTWQFREADELMHKLEAKSRDFVEKYLAAPSEKALARSSKKYDLRAAWGFATVELARARALDDCAKHNPEEQCIIVLENDRWVDNPVAIPSVPTLPLVGQYGGP
jgi:dienelactone hydrolase